MSGEIVEVHLAGLAEFDASVDAMVAAVAAVTGPATAKAAHLVEDRVKRDLKRKAHKKGEPTNAAPGEPPATVTGTLARSEQVEGPEEVGFGHYVAAVGPTVIYGRIQELGGTAGRGAKLPARPSLFPAVEASEADIRAIAEAEWAKALSGFAG